jgi:hypothetical protein
MHAMYPQRQGPEDCLTIAILTGERMRVWAMCELGYTQSPLAEGAARPSLNDSVPSPYYGHARITHPAHQSLDATT